MEQPNLSVISYEGVFRRCVIITSRIFFFSPSETRIHQFMVCQECLHPTVQRFIATPPLFFLGFVFTADSFVRLCLTLPHFACAPRPLSLHQSLSFISLNLSVLCVIFFPRPPLRPQPHPPLRPQRGDTPCVTPLLPAYGGRMKAEGCDFPFSEARRSHKQPGGLVGSQMVAAELSFC